ncbi:MAG: Hpt domain-containing protein [Rhodospirillaceae bacterium]|nr:Hpt domain-containing protein [Rhodospirillaceae bacterium]
MPDRRTIEEMIDAVGKDGMRELYDVFKSDAIMRLNEIRDRKNADGDLSVLKRHAHSLKGVCRTYGLPDSGELAFDLEQTIDTGIPEKILQAAEKVLLSVPGDIEDGEKLVAELTVTSPDNNS